MVLLQKGEVQVVKRVELFQEKLEALEEETMEAMVVEVQEKVEAVEVEMVVVEEQHPHVEESAEVGQDQVDKEARVKVPLETVEVQAEEVVEAQVGEVVVEAKVGEAHRQEAKLLLVMAEGEEEG